jgi:hypothetical protein
MIMHRSYGRIRLSFWKEKKLDESESNDVLSELLGSYAQYTTMSVAYSGSSYSRKTGDKSEK